jgi:hypothetical protein
MKLFIISIATLYALTFPDCTTNEYCFRNGDSFVILEMVKREGDCSKKEEGGDRIREYYYRKEEVVSLSDEYKFCNWSHGLIRAKVNLDGNLTLATSFGFLKTSTDRQTECKEYDSVVIFDVSRFYCYSENGVSSEVNCLEKNGKYNELILPILKNSIGKTFTADIAIEVSCPRDANDTNYTEKKTLKINRLIIVIGECPN